MEIKREVKSKHNMATAEKFIRQVDSRKPQVLIKVNTGRQMSW